MASIITPFVYENAPLIEVIAEVRWELLPVASIPGASLDPFFNPLSSGFADEMGKKGFVHIDRLLPPDAPLELFGGHPALRLRRAPNTWPLFQLGPGVFTCNSVPPYDGWTGFREILDSGLQVLERTYPFGGKNLKTVSKSLRYIDGFTAKHGLKAFSAFVQEHLGVTVDTPDGFIERFAPPETDPKSVIELRFPAKQCPGSDLVVKVQPGSRDRMPAVIVELLVLSTSSPAEELVPEQVASWMENAHGVLHEVFESLTSTELKGLMGPKRIIGESAK